jgi:type II secretory ATPase GspE/PulE/Tfp pilus assembly ATPase PilB-like protein
MTQSNIKKFVNNNGALSILRENSGQSINYILRTQTFNSVKFVNSLDQTSANSNDNGSKKTDDIDFDIDFDLEAAEIEDFKIDNSDENNAIVNLVNKIILKSSIIGASDIHIEPSKNSVQIRYRVDGSLINGPLINSNISNYINARIKIMANLNITEKRKPQDGKTTVNIDGRTLDLRISTIPNNYGERCVIRVLDGGNLGNVIDYNLQSDEFKEIVEISNQKNGFLIVCGPTGSGKSTTMYSLITTLNKGDINILTIEDPVEYEIEGVGQTQVDEDNGITFKEGLKSILRQDPDVILIGEIRDADTAKIAIQSSITGHMVFSTLHTKSTFGAINRLKSLGVDKELISSSLSGIISQRLVKKLCHCKVKNVNPVKVMGVSIPNSFNPQGCPDCNNTGFKGRVPVYGILKNSSALKMAILEDKSEDEIAEIVGGDGVEKMCVRLVTAGITSADEIVSSFY